MRRGAGAGRGTRGRPGRGGGGGRAVTLAGDLHPTAPRVPRRTCRVIASPLSAARMWKALTFFVALPGVAVSMLNVFLKSQHDEHERPEFVAYPHLRIRSKVRRPASCLGVEVLSAGERHQGHRLMQKQGGISLQAYVCRGGCARVQHEPETASPEPARSLPAVYSISDHRKLP